MIQIFFIYGKITLFVHVHKYEWKWRNKGIYQRVVMKQETVNTNYSGEGGVSRVDSRKRNKLFAL